ncbi:hypothetical protein phiC2p81 [Clostridioides phage phiC2]|uniref:Uncharacterized protein n=1 Tax=Clostridioides phage phiC2 TaxID=2849703 RepID=A3QSG9_9CAUD|nr:hypothetical protein phiC2p81 [Clostridioides phage phiC2]ABE99541.1 hypothetical protein phiC2p81 [Clostridioides phage phiC2]
MGISGEKLGNFLIFK